MPQEGVFGAGFGDVCARFSLGGVSLEMFAVASGDVFGDDFGNVFWKRSSGDGFRQNVFAVFLGDVFGDHIGDVFFGRCLEGTSWRVSLRLS